MGPSGCGKSFFAKKISKKLNIPIYDLDDYFWIDKYTKILPKEKREEKIKKILIRKKWIIEGVYSTNIDNILKKTDLLVWLNYSSKTLSWRLLTRYLKRKITKGPKENLKDTVKLIKFSRLYSTKTSRLYKKHKKLRKKHKVFVVTIKNNKQLNKFLKDLK